MVCLQVFLYKIETIWQKTSNTRNGLIQKIKMDKPTGQKTITSDSVKTIRAYMENVIIFLKYCNWLSMFTVYHSVRMQ